MADREGESPAPEVEDAMDRIDRALVDVRRRIEAHGGILDVVFRPVDGHVQVRLRGACRGCPALTSTYLAAVRPALARLPEVSGVDFVGPAISRYAESRIRSMYHSGHMSVD